MKNTLIETIKEKLIKIKIELVHEGYHDGWCLKYLREKKTKLELELAEAEKLVIN
jgi:hypothetical protein